METHHRRQAWRPHDWDKPGRVGSDLILPNPKLKPLDQVREVQIYGAAKGPKGSRARWRSTGAASPGRLPDRAVAAKGV